MSGILSLAGMNSRQPFVSLRIASDDRQKFGIRALELRIATAENPQSAMPNSDVCHWHIQCTRVLGAS